MPDLINSETTNLLSSGDISLIGMFRDLLTVALGAAAGAAAGAVALGAVSLGFFFFSGDFILLVEVVPDIDYSLSSRCDFFGICLLLIFIGEPTLGI